MEKIRKEVSHPTEINKKKLANGIKKVEQYR